LEKILCGTGRQWRQCTYRLTGKDSSEGDEKEVAVLKNLLGEGRVASLALDPTLEPNSRSVTDTDLRALPLRQQQGSVMIITLIGIAIMLLLGTTALTNSSLDERSAASMADRYLAHEEAMAAIVDTEQKISAWLEEPQLTEDLTVAFNAGAVWKQGFSETVVTSLGRDSVGLLSDADWNAAQNHVTPSLSDSQTWPARVIIEEYDPDPPVTPDPRYQGRRFDTVYYRITARARGETNGRATVQSIFVREF
jgi:Tfp pilus assembly protein PilX